MRLTGNRVIIEITLAQRASTVKGLLKIHFHYYVTRVTCAYGWQVSRYCSKVIDIVCSVALT